MRILNSMESEFPSAFIYVSPLCIEPSLSFIFDKCPSARVNNLIINEFSCRIIGIEWKPKQKFSTRLYSIEKKKKNTRTRFCTRVRYMIDWKVNCGRSCKIRWNMHIHTLINRRLQFHVAKKNIYIYPAQLAEREKLTSGRRSNASLRKFRAKKAWLNVYTRAVRARAPYKHSAISNSAAREWN